MAAKGWKEGLAWVVLAMGVGCSTSDRGGDSASPYGGGEVPRVSPTLPFAMDEGTGVDSNDGAYSVVYRALGGSIPVSDVFGLEVLVFDGCDGAATRVPEARILSEGVELEVDARMPEHRHGMVTVPIVRKVGRGHFEVEGMMFHMPGRWQLTFDVLHDGVAERAQIDLEIE